MGFVLSVHTRSFCCRNSAAGNKLRAHDRPTGDVPLSKSQIRPRQIQRIGSLVDQVALHYVIRS